MRVMCLNGWGGRLWAELAPFIAATAPSVLCLQEVIHSPATDRDWLTYRDGDHVLPQRANFFRDVGRLLPEHTAIFCPAARGVLWDDGAAVPSQWGLATFVHGSLPIIGQVQGFVHKDYSAAGYGDHPRCRNAHGIRVFDDTRGRPVCITHMHGLRDLHGKQDTPERAAQARRLLDMSQRLSQPGDLTLLCGDFNVEPDSETLRILQAAGMVELVTAAGFTSTRTSHYPKPGKYADYMLIDRDEAVRDFCVIDDPEVSDHRPLLVVL